MRENEKIVNLLISAILPNYISSSKQSRNAHPRCHVPSTSPRIEWESIKQERILHASSFKPNENLFPTKTILRTRGNAAFNGCTQEQGARC